MALYVTVGYTNGPAVVKSFQHSVLLVRVMTAPPSAKKIAMFLRIKTAFILQVTELHFSLVLI